MDISSNSELLPVGFPDRLNWCFSTLGCSELSLAGQTRLARQWGIRRLELRGVEGMIDFPSYASQFAWANRLAPSCMSGDDVAVCAIGSSLSLSDTPRVIENGLVEYARWMDFFGCPFIRVFDGALFAGGKGLESAWRQLDAWEALRERHGWKFSVMIETHGSLFRTDYIAMLFSRGHPHVRLLWDSHHTWRQTGECPLTTWKELRRWTAHIHIKDSVAVPSEGHPYTYVLPFEGEFPLRELLGRLSTDQFAGAVSLEWERHWHSGLPELNTALAALLQGVRAAGIC